MKTAPFSSDELIDFRALGVDDWLLACSEYSKLYGRSPIDLLRHNDAARRFLPNTISRARIERFSKVFLLAKLKGSS